LSQGTRPRATATGARPTVTSPPPVNAELEALSADLQNKINNLIGITIQFVLGYDGSEGCEVCKDFHEKAEPIVRDIIRDTRKIEKFSRQTVSTVRPQALEVER